MSRQGSSQSQASDYSREGVMASEGGKGERGGEGPGEEGGVGNGIDLREREDGEDMHTDVE